MAFDDRSKLWEAAKEEGRKARLEEDSMMTNPYRPDGPNGEAALYVCWRRGWMEVDRELAAREEKGRESRPLYQKLVAL